MSIIAQRLRGTLALLWLGLLGLPLRAEDTPLLEYAHTVYRAHVEYRNGNTARSLELLETCRDAERGWEWYYVQRLCRQEHLALPTNRPDGGKCNFMTAHYSPDGKWILTADGDTHASLWDARTGAWVRSFTDGKSAIGHAHFNHDGTQVLTSNDGAVATIWDASTGKQVRTLERKQRAIGAANWSPDGKQIVTSGNRDLTVWDAATGKELHTFASYAFYSCQPIFSKDGTMILSNGFSRSGTFDARSGQQLVRVEPGGNGTMNIARFHPDGTRFVASANDGIARVHKTDNGEKLLELKGHQGGIAAAGYSADGKQIVTAGGDRTLRLWDASTGHTIKTWQGNTGFLDAHIHPDGEYILSVEPGAVKVWRIAAEPVQVLPVEQGSWIIDMAFRPDGTQIAAGSTGKIGFHVDIWDVAAGRVKHVLKGHDYVVHNVVYSPDGSRLLTRTGTGRTKLWDANTGEQLRDFDGTDKMAITTIAGFNGDGTKIVTLKGGGLQLWDVKSGERGREFKGGGLQLWDVKSGERGREFKPTDAIRAYWPSPGKGELTILTNGKLSRWNETTGETNTEVALADFPKAFERVWLAPNGQRMLVAERTGPVSLWDATTGKKLRTLTGFRCFNESMVAFTPDSKRIALATAGDKHVHVLDTATGLELLAFPALSKPVGCVTFSPDGTRLLAGTSGDGPLHLHTGGPAPKPVKK